MWAAAIAGLVGAFGPVPAAAKPSTSEARVTVRFTAGHPVNSFVPETALGAALDGYEQGDIARIYTAHNISRMLSAGFKPVTYRLRTELGVEAWHWNPAGSWSDAVHLQGYWTSSSKSALPVEMCNGYRLPRRGDTKDQANNDGYSRIDDGDTHTFWKSNPYLDQHFTGDSNALHPQWVLVDLGKRRPVNTIRLLWGVPFALRYRVDYYTGADAMYAERNPDGGWKPFPGGAFRTGHGGLESLRLSKRPISVRFVRVWMTASSETAPLGSRDVRDRLGYALREIYLGETDTAGRFHDFIHHTRDGRKQTVIYASSTDPWHRAQDRDVNTEQPGFDRVFRSKLTNGLPVMIPVGVLYDTPDNAAAEIRFLESRGYNVKQVELGEEPDGQYILPEDYAALFVQFARALHSVDPKLQLGGPSFQPALDGWHAWPNAAGETSWMGRFLGYLRTHGHSDDFRFFTFEWYPLEDVCAPAAPQLMEAPEILDHVMQTLHQDGVPTSIPWMISEYGYSVYAGKPEAEMAGALLNGELAAQFLTLGGARAYLYGYEPNPLMDENPCHSWGELTLWLADDNGKARKPLATYWAAVMLTHHWVQPGKGTCQVFPAASDARDKHGRQVVSAYALRRPDGKWSVLLINKDPRRRWKVELRITDGATRKTRLLRGPADLFQYSGEQYRWHAHGENGHPNRDRPPTHRVLEHMPAHITLPPFSLTVLRGY